MPIFICAFLIPPLAALLLALKASGKRKLLAWGIFALLVMPLAVGGVGGLLLSANGLAWRSCVKLPVGMAYVAGVLALLVWVGVFVWRIETVGRRILIPALALVALAVGWYGLLFSAIWAGRDRLTEYNGQTAVAEQTWMDWDYYAYHGPLVRGETALGHSWEDGGKPK